MKKTINKLDEYFGPSFAGNPTLQGGPYGYGHTKQLAKTDPAVDKVKKQQDSEHNVNAKDLEYVGSINERTPSDAFAPAPHLPGNRSPSSIEKPTNFIPQEDPDDTADYYMMDQLINELIEDEVFAYKDAPELPLGGMGVVLAPKSHVPEEFPQSSKFEDDDNDGIPNHVDPNLPNPLHLETEMEEKLDPEKHDAGDYIEDFQDSDAPQFKGKSEKKKKEMALAAYYSAKKNEQIKRLQEKVLKKLMEKLNVKNVR